MSELKGDGVKCALIAKRSFGNSRPAFVNCRAPIAGELPTLSVPEQRCCLPPCKRHTHLPRKVAPDIAVSRGDTSPARVAQPGHASARLPTRYPPAEGRLPERLYFAESDLT